MHLFCSFDISNLFSKEVKIVFVQLDEIVIIAITQHADNCLRKKNQVL